MSAGALSTTLTNPLWVIKTRLMVILFFFMCVFLFTPYRHKVNVRHIDIITQYMHLQQSQKKKDLEDSIRA